MGKSKIIIALFSAIILVSGCKTAAERRANQHANDSAKCSSFGFKPGSTEFATCMMQQDTTRKQAETMREEMNRAAKCAEIRNTVAYGAGQGIAKGIALGMNRCGS